MGIFALNDDTLACVCTLLSPRDALVLALSCKQLCPVALARVSTHVVLSTPDQLRRAWGCLTVPDRARHIRLLRMRVRLHACDAPTRATAVRTMEALVGAARAESDARREALRETYAAHMRGAFGDPMEGLCEVRLSPPSPPPSQLRAHRR